MRDQLDTIIEQKDCEYSNIIHKYLSTKSRFTKDREYVTSENDFILQIMQMKV